VLTAGMCSSLPCAEHEWVERQCFLGLGAFASTLGLQLSRLRVPGSLQRCQIKAVSYRCDDNTGLMKPTCCSCTIFFRVARGMGRGIARKLS